MSKLWSGVDGILQHKWLQVVLVTLGVAGAMGVLAQCGGDQNPESVAQPAGDKSGADESEPAVFEVDPVTQREKSELIPFFEPTPSWGDAPLDTTLKWEFSADLKAPVRCTLDLDADGAIDKTIDDCKSTGSVPFTYEKHGRYLPRLTVEDATGARGQATTEVFANYIEFAPVVQFVEKLPGFRSTTAVESEVTLEFERADDVLKLDAGTILWSSTGEGYLRKVVSVKSSGAVLTVVTEPAKLDEAVKEGFFGARDVVADQSMARCVENCDGVELLTVQPEQSVLDGRYSGDVVLSQVISMREVSFGTATLRDVAFTVSNTYSVLIDIGWTGLQEFQFRTGLLTFPP